MSSGTSVADVVHQVIDGAENLSGLGSNRSEKQSDGQADHASRGPGNHPNDPRANINHPDTNTVPTSAKEKGSATEKGQGPVSKATEASGRSKESIEKSLDNQELARKRLGAGVKEEEEEQQQVRETAALTDAANAALEQPLKEKEENHHHSGSEEVKNPEDSNEIKQEHHVADRGAIWASRPTDEQREKVRKAKEEKGQGGRSYFLSFSGKDAGKTKESSEEPSQKQEAGEAGSPSERGGGGGRTGLNNIFAGAASKFRSGSGDSYKQQAAGSSSPLQSNQSQWSHNDRSLRGAFEADADGEAKSSGNEAERSAEASNGPGSQAPVNGSVPGTPLTPTGNKMKAITKIMLMGSDKAENGRQNSGDSTEAAAANGDGEGSAPQTPGAATTSVTRWSRLKQKIQDSQKAAKREEAKTGASGVDLTRELGSGILPVFLLKMSLERDEQNHRRIPVLLNHLRLRVTDSVNPLHNTHAVFRIELEYGDGLVKWVVYRELRDFINLHAHYRAAALRGYLGKSVGSVEGDLGLPSFPKTSLPYFNQLQRQGRTDKAEFAKAQRDALENYIIELIRRTMFRPEANRLCKFFEISALSVSLASRGGYQGKQGYLRILSKSSRKNDQKGILTPAKWAKSHQPKWFIVRESFIVIVNQPDTLQIYDVFLMDNEFVIERPKRLYKQTMHLAHGISRSDEKPTQQSSEQSNDYRGAGAAGGEKAKQDTTRLLTDGQFADPHRRDGARAHKDDPNRHVSSHTFYIRNAERRLKLVAKNERQMDQFIASMQKVANRNIFGGSNRFGSFAPIRLNASAQWLVDGRDYFWNVSKALMMAKDRIFIHDWWLSPELYLRRPGHPKWRLDNILKRKAEEGVKIFVIIYNEVSNNFTPTDSNYTKQRLIGLHHNIFVQRSPSHFQTGTFYWAHHEKLCVIDETIAFMGGLDLCFGRWDTPAHVLVDDHLYDSQDGNTYHEHPALLGPAKDGKEAHIWPGQDYANERVMEWHTLSKPEQDLFPRDKFPRMPWHDTGIQLIGQPARDLCRHFSQRWNFLLRIKNHTRVMPFLVPPPDFTPAELQKYGLTGTCETQICRSAGPWSLGTSSKVEHSIQNAYLKAIQMSDHFVYIENQFFVTSTVVEGVTIENKIGEALVSRIIKAHREGTAWRAIVVIPLTPGFPMPIDHADASSVRLIVELQNRSICRGEHSIFGKLRREGINPEDYISFFSLRGWGKLRGGRLCTEQVYIHGKIMIVDDRLALIGSANINERSQRGDRDSELACVVRDHDMMDGTMAGKPYKVGRFAHTLRVQLMREHLGVDVDELEKEENDKVDRDEPRHSDEDSDQSWEPESDVPRAAGGEVDGSTKVEARSTAQNYKRTAGAMVSEVGAGAGREIRGRMKDLFLGEGAEKEEFEGLGDPSERLAARDGDRRPNSVPTLEEQAVADERDSLEAARTRSREETNARTSLAAQVAREDEGQDSTSTTTTHQDERQQQQHPGSTKQAGEKPPQGHGRTATSTSNTQRGLGRAAAEKSNHHMRNSPSAVSFGGSVNVSVNGHHGGGGEANNKEELLKRKMSAKMSANPWSLPVSAPEVDPYKFEDPLADGFYKDYWVACAVHNTQIYRKVFKCVPDDKVGTWQEYKAYMAWSERLSRSFGGASGGEAAAGLGGGGAGGGVEREKDQGEGGGGGGGNGMSEVKKSAATKPSRSSSSSSTKSTTEGREEGLEDQGAGNGRSPTLNHGGEGGGHHQRQTTNGGGGAKVVDEGFSAKELEQMEALLEQVRGTLVVHPTKFLEAEDMSNNFLFAMDRINPLVVYD